MKNLSTAIGSLGAPDWQTEKNAAEQVLKTVAGLEKKLGWFATESDKREWRQFRIFARWQIFHARLMENRRAA